MITKEAEIFLKSMTFEQHRHRVEKAIIAVDKAKLYCFECAVRLANCVVDGHHAQIGAADAYRIARRELQRRKKRLKQLQCSMNTWMALKYNYQDVGA